MKKKAKFLIGIFLLVIIVWGVTMLGLKRSHDESKDSPNIELQNLIK